MFVIFAVRVIYKDETSTWMPIGEFDIHYTDERIFNIDTFPTWEIDIDFAQPQLAQNKMIEITEKVEAQCPVGAYFGVKGATVWLVNGKVCSSVELTDEVKQHCADVLKLDLNPTQVITLSF